MTSIEFLFKELWETSKDKLEWHSILEKAKEMHNKEVELSDEEIEKASRDYDNGTIYGPPLVNFEQGAFWYREQLKQRQCNK
jgi:ABC-type glycerol-3-phosphate transport system substrate-binding protein